VRGDLHSFVFYSDDEFQTWKISDNTMTAPGRGAHEPTIVELRDGRLLCLLRTTQKSIFKSYSEDKGMHWSVPSPTELPAPDSPPLLRRIPSTGDLLLLWNHVASDRNSPRTPLTAAISRDEGESWEHLRDIENRTDHDAAYAAVYFEGNEALVTYYTRNTNWARDAEVMLRIFNIQQFYE
jgi:sialidase-1